MQFTGASLLLPHQQGESGEEESSGSIVNDVDLAGVKAGFELVKRDIQLKDRGLAAGFVEGFRFDDRCLKRFHPALKESNVGMYGISTWQFAT